MSRVVWLNDGLVDPATACLSIDDPGVRFGAGLFETMRSQDGAVPWLDRHLDRLERSISALELDPTPPIAQVRGAALHVAASFPTGPARVRVTVTPHPTLVVEGTPVELDPDMTLTAATVRAAWHPNRVIAEHKTLSFLGWRDAERRARATGADIALLLDADGRLGEASSANVFCVIGDELVTAPARGLLPGVTRRIVMDLAATHEAILDEDVWRASNEMFVTSAVRGIVPIVRCDDAPVGQGVGPTTWSLMSQVNTLLT